MIIVDEVGYLPFEQAAATLDRIVHHADVHTLKGASDRLRGRALDSPRNRHGQAES